MGLIKWLPQALAARQQLDQARAAAIQVARSAAVEVAPQARIGRSRSGRRSFASSDFDRFLSDWIAAGTSADSEIRDSLGPLRRRSRQLCRDNDYARNAKRILVSNVVGTGMRFQARVRRDDGTLDKAINQEIEGKLLRWMEAAHCHTGAKLHFADIEGLAIGSAVESGEYLVRLVRRAFRGSEIPLALELIEVDQLADEFNGSGTQYSGIAPGNLVRMGIEYDQWKAPVAYWLHPNHPGDYQYLWNQQGKRLQRVPAEEILHPFVSERIGQSRGVPWFYSALRRLHHLGKYEESELIAARAAASIMGFLEIEGDGEYEGDDTDEDGTPIEEFEPGIIRQLRPGQKFNMAESSRPNQVVEPFLRFMLRGVAAGIGTSYAGVSGDYSQTNYSSSRLELLSVREHYRTVQGWQMRGLNCPVYRAWLDAAHLAGALDLPRYWSLQGIYYNAARWTPRGWNWVDPAKEVAANAAAVKAGFTSRTQIVAETTGRDFEEVLEELAEEQRLMQALGLTLDLSAAPTAPTEKEKDDE